MTHFKSAYALLLLFGAVTAGSNTASAQAAAGKGKRPNIIFILSDDHAYQAIGAYGNKIAKTPNIDRISKEGALFKNAIVTNSICGPSRATFLTGKYSHKNGYPMNEQKFDTDQQLFPSLLQEGGYQTAWLGKWHLGNLPKGFDYYNILNGQGQYYNPDFISSAKDTVQIEGYVSNIITQLATQWLDKRDESKPFFLVVGEKATHREWFPDLQDLGAYDDVTFPLPSTFYDDYESRLAAKDQDMTIDQTMILKDDLKIHADYDLNEGQIQQEKEALIKKRFANTAPTAAQEKALDYYLRKGLYRRFNPEQKRVFSAYYNKVTAEFDQKKLTGKALVEWKFQRYMKDYLSTANSLDRNIGKLLDYLDKSGLAENTVVIYASDNGFYLGEHGWFDKRFIYEESLHVPLVVRYPKVVKPGSVIKGTVLNNDWGPTVLDIAGIKTPVAMQGRSFLPLLKNEAAVKDWRKDAYYHYYEFPKPHHVHPHFGIRAERYTLVRFYGEINSWELFDLQKDPQELHNLYGTKGSEAVTADLKLRLKKLIAEYEDTEALKIFEQKI
ncbi:Arylsulfatase A [Pedobacter westerhofensis]|uniref:Arylsulfatase A n=1 Tax=Pedobacter westerhofensis TaxID=425512 RepID=A0A521BEV4_9SPHI|nr:sulfatase [Pedobacter westerhofensis]SMO45626.1 Arylsulfatase A [Pedobacter westerhofensis]